MNKYQKLNESIAILNQASRQAKKVFETLPAKEYMRFQQRLVQSIATFNDIVFMLQDEAEILKMKSPSQHAGFYPKKVRK